MTSFGSVIGRAQSLVSMEILRFPRLKLLESSPVSPRFPNRHIDLQERGGLRANSNFTMTKNLQKTKREERLRKTKLRMKMNRMSSLKQYLLRTTVIREQRVSYQILRKTKLRMKMNRMSSLKQYLLRT